MPNLPFSRRAGVDGILEALAEGVAESLDITADAVRQPRRYRLVSVLSVALSLPFQDLQPFPGHGRPMGTGRLPRLRQPLPAQT
jgi:hypothetical protein